MKTISTEEKILNEAGELFFRHGIKCITMDDIASHLGMSKKTIYNFYTDKNLIVQSLTNKELEHQIKDLHDIRRTSVDPVEEIVKVMSHVGQTFTRICPTLFFDLKKYHPAAWLSFKSFKETEMIGFIEENLRKGVKLELYRKELQIKILARLRIEEVEIGFNTVYFPENKYNISEVQLALLDHFLHGIVTLKGFKLINKYKKSLTTKIVEQKINNLSNRHP
jgi:TetR/AcrR family transcriptional regulator, cholesterol catabolism regulator